MCIICFDAGLHISFKYIFINQASNKKQEVEVILFTSIKKVHQSRSPYVGMTPTYGGHPFLAHLVFYQMSLCNHLSVMHSCQCHCRHLCTALLAMGFKIETSYLV